MGPTLTAARRPTNPDHGFIGWYRHPNVAEDDDGQRVRWRCRATAGRGADKDVGWFVVVVQGLSTGFDEAVLDEIAGRYAMDVLGPAPEGYF